MRITPINLLSDKQKYLALNHSIGLLNKKQFEDLATFINELYDDEHNAKSPQPE